MLGIKRRPNRLMHCMVSISLMVHVVIFLHIAGIYRSEAVTYIELAMQDVSKSPVRNIPRPRVRHKPPEALSAKKIDVQKQPMPHVKIEPVKNEFSESLMAPVAAPESLETPDLNISPWHPDGTAEYVTPNDYFDMLKLKIESGKKYPKAAMARHHEGRATVRFVISPEGRVSGLKIVRGTRYASLDQAALRAVKDAAPFPKPPSHLFDGALVVEVTIMFELT